VFGDITNLREMMEVYGVNQVFISIPSATGTELRRIIEICKSCGISYKTLPGMGEIMDGKVSIKALRDVNYTDLLRREPCCMITPP
jgi:FlaA1/EpsC-like NDP-sugar epimerase